MALNIFSEYERRFATEADLRVAVEDLLDHLVTCKVSSYDDLDEAFDKVVTLEAGLSEAENAACVAEKFLALAEEKLLRFYAARDKLSKAVEAIDEANKELSDADRD